MTEAPKGTDQQTAPGRRIEASSFAQVDAEAGDKSRYDADQWAMVRRMIHATGDFDFNGRVRFHPAAMAAGFEAVRAGAPIYADVEMIRAGVSAPRLERFGMRIECRINDPETLRLADEHGTTRSEQAVALAAQEGVLDGAIVAVGNAPTALRAILRRTLAGEIQPRLILAMPVGFVDAAESKAAIMETSPVPWIAITGRKGGSPLAVAALHALLALNEEPS